MREKVEEVLAKIRPMLGSADVRLVDVGEGVVTVEHLKQLSACDLKRRGPITKGVVLEILEAEFERELPEIREVIVV